MASSTVGSSTRTFWNRRSSAASFSMCLRYSSRVVAPTQCNCPLDKAGFNMLPASMAPSALPGADDVVQLVDEENDLSLLPGKLVEYRLQAFLELAAKLGAGNQRAQVQGEDSLRFQSLGYLAIGDPLRQALHDGRLANPRFADEHRVVLGAALKDLDRAADFIVPADHRDRVCPAPPGQ